MASGLRLPGDIEQEWLDKLDQTDDAAVAGFCWASLPGNNDGQIMAAAYLNLIGNVYVHCRDGDGEEWDDEHFTDKFGNTHIVRKFKTPQQLEAALLASNEQAAYFDIDLDFFTYRNHYTEGGGRFTYMPKRKIVDLLARKRYSCNGFLSGWLVLQLQRSRSFVAAFPNQTSCLTS
ncbi:hypothetical protein [Hymenobacter sp. BRD67]|uniref:hypothetical protein n=1 Tax=Hymenobacter sp. BRD67 TaxID=2675877 RepID=UPI00156523C8|nr:hypothetical protein [Hymenobacter sp. BRD67]QKG54901.1 hypothetical protein GKZ67_20960 [Hymenobacter sp. BRD67]